MLCVAASLTDRRTLVLHAGCGASCRGGDVFASFHSSLTVTVNIGRTNHRYGLVSFYALPYH